MTKGEYPYPPDEFDAVDPSAGPRGVHRHPRSRWATAWPYLVALVVAGCLGLAVVNLVWDERESTPSAQGAVEEPVVDPSPTTEPTPVEPTPPERSLEPPALDTPVSVFNSTSVAGLAAGAAEQLEDAGWSEVVTGNRTGDQVRASTVTYGQPELEASARAVADVLGISTVELAESDPVDGIEVVLERDFAS